MALVPPVRRLLARTLVHRFFWLACLVTFVALVYAEEDWRAWHNLKQFEDKWAPTGVKFSLIEVAPAPVPDDQNFALTPIVASSYAMYMDKNGRELYPRNTNVVERLKMSSEDYRHDVPVPQSGNWALQNMTDLGAWQNYYRALAAKTNEFPIPSQPGTPGADVLLALGKYDSDIEELRQASQLPYSRFPLTYLKDDPAAILLPHLAALKSASSTLKLRASAELQAGEADKALADVKLMLCLNNSIRTEPVLISGLVRVAIFEITLQPIYEGLAAHRWSDDQLVELDAALSSLDFLASYKTVMQGELGFGISETEYMRRERNFQALNNFPVGESQDHPLQDVSLRLIPSGFFYQNELQLARMDLLYILPSVDLGQCVVLPATVKQNQEAADEDLRTHLFSGFFARMVLPAIMNSVEKFTRAQANLDMARLAVALERYRLAHGEYPQTLDVLSPQYLAAIPHDVINGQPLHYRRTDDGQFLLYSVGWNETDDGGVVARGKFSTPGMDPNHGDWVWKYPSK